MDLPAYALLKTKLRSKHMNKEVVDALITATKQAIDSKVNELKEDLIENMGASQRRMLIQLAKASVKEESLSIGKDLRGFVEELVKSIPEPKNGEDGEDGKDGVSVTADQIAQAVGEWMAANLIQPKDGVDGENGTDGKDAAEITPAQIEQAAQDWLTKNIHQAKDGTDGKDGDDGKDGKDAEQITPEQVEKFTQDWLTKNIQQPKDGIDGQSALDGKDAAELDILPDVDESKAYSKGTWASYRGGLIKSTRTTSPIVDGKTLQESGWDIVVQGVRSVEVHQIADGEFAVKTLLTGGQDHLTKFAVPVMIYKDIYQDGAEYKQGNTVTYSGSLWHCQKATSDKPGTSDSWRLVAKRGRDGKSGDSEKANKSVVRL